MFATFKMDVGKKLFNVLQDTLMLTGQKQAVVRMFWSKLKKVKVTVT